MHHRLPRRVVLGLFVSIFALLMPTWAAAQVEPGTEYEAGDGVVGIVLGGVEGDDGGLHHYLVGLTFSPNGSLNEFSEDPIDSMVIVVESGSLVVQAETGTVIVDVGAGEPIATPEGEFICETVCPVEPGMAVQLEPGNIVTLMQSTFTVIDVTANATASPAAATPSALTFKANGGAKASASIVFSNNTRIGGCAICPRQ